MSDRDARLRQFFSGWFHQDWDVNGATTWQEVVEAFLSQYPIDHLLKIRDDLRTWLSDTIGGVPKEFGCDYNPQSDNLDEREWVSAIAHYIDTRTCSNET